MDYEKVYKENISYRNSPKYQSYGLALRDYYHSIDEERFMRNFNKDENKLEIIQKADKKVVLSIELPKIVNLYKMRFIEEKQIFKNMNVLKDLLYQYKVLGKQSNYDEKEMDEYTRNLKIDKEDYDEINKFFNKTALFFKSLEDERNEYFKNMNLYSTERKKHFELLKIDFSEKIKLKILEIFKAEGIPTKSERYTTLENELHIKKEKIQAYLKWCEASVLFIKNQRKFNDITRKIKKELEQQADVLSNFIIKDAKVNRILDDFASSKLLVKRTKISKTVKESIKGKTENKPKKIIIVKKKKN